MEILTFLLVHVGLAEINRSKLVVGCFSLVFAGLDRSRSIVRSTALRVVKACLGVRSSTQKNW